MPEFECAYRSSVKSEILTIESTYVERASIGIHRKCDEFTIPLYINSTRNQKLIASNGAAADRSGHSVALDGNRAPRARSIIKRSLPTSSEKSGESGFACDYINEL